MLFGWLNDNCIWVLKLKNIEHLGQNMWAGYYGYLIHKDLIHGMCIKSNITFNLWQAGSI